MSSFPSLQRQLADAKAASTGRPAVVAVVGGGGEASADLFVPSSSVGGFREGPEGNSMELQKTGDPWPLRGVLLNQPSRRKKSHNGRLLHKPPTTFA